MDAINVMPAILVHRIYNGYTMTGVEPVTTAYSLSYDNLASGVFSVADSLTWTGGTGTLLSVTKDGTEGTMVFSLDSGVVPYNNLEITNSTATCDVNGTPVGGVYADSGEGIQRGRYRHVSGLTNGGLVSFPVTTAKYGFRVLGVSLGMPGITAVTFYIVDPYGNSVGAGTLTPSSGVGYKEWLNGGIFVAPGCKFKAVGTGTLSADGEIMFAFGPGWGASTFEDNPQLGSNSLPPSR